MTDNEILKNIKNYFNIKELVDKATYNAHGERAWKFLDIRLLEIIIIIRETINKPISVNSWHKGGSQQQRGLRTNICDIVKKKTKAGKLYLSAHTMGKALDFDVEDMTAPEVRKWLVANGHIFPYKIRLEDTLGGKQISWVHLDIYHEDKNPHVYLMAV